MDFYLDNDNVYIRLENEFKKYRKLIIAYDFDDTVYDFHNTGKTFWNLISILQRWRKYSELIVFTGCEESQHKKIESYLTENEIPFDSINGDSVVKTNSRKIYYNVLLDDRAGISVAYNCLLRLIEKIENGEFDDEI